jgi:hypothetical protein
MMPSMDKSKLDVAQLQKRDPAAWTLLLRGLLQTEDVSVKNVQVTTLRPCPGGRCNHHAYRYILTLKDHSDPITLQGKRTSKVETSFYANIASQLPQLAPNCIFVFESGDEGWLLIDDVPDDFPPHKWTTADVEEVIHGLTDLHACFWNQGDQLRSQGMSDFAGSKRYSWPELKAQHEVYFEEGPASALSEHAIDSAGRLAPVLLQAANGLTVMRELGGWPGVFGESHLIAAADLLDDPLPMLEPLRNVPATLIHGNPYGYHWRLTLFDELRLIDWQKASIGSGIYDLVSFVEQCQLLYDQRALGMRLRRKKLATEETIVDSYMLAMSGKLGPQFDARAMRQVVPAARCLYVLSTWFTEFARWSSYMPGKYTWQKVNRLSDQQLAGTVYEPILALRRHLATTFRRFLQAYRTL